MSAHALKSAVPFHSCKDISEAPWDGGKDIAAIRRYCSSDGSGDKDKMDWGKYEKFFTWVDSKNREAFDSYKCPHHKIVDGKFVLLRHKLAMNVAELHGGRAGGLRVPESDLSGIESHLRKHYEEDLKEPFPEGKPSTQNAEKSMPDDTLVCFGDAAKSLGDGKIGGYLVRFSGPDDPDLTSEFFTKSTDFWLDGEAAPARRVIYHHGFDPKMEIRKLGLSRLKLDEAGIWAEAQLDLRDEYERKIEGMVKDGKLGWSSGSAPHLVRMKRVGKAKQILSWPIVEATLTPTPAEPRNGVVPLKSLKVMSEGDTDQPDAELKAFKPGMHVRHRGGEGCGEVKEVMDGDETKAEPMARVDMHDDECKCTGAMKCYPVKDLEGMRDGDEDDDADDDSYDESTKTTGRCQCGAVRGKSGAESVPFVDHSREVVSAVGGYVERSEARLGARVKAGRELSAANRAEIETCCAALESGVERLRKILDRTKADDDKAESVDQKALLRLRGSLLSFDDFLANHPAR